MESILSTDGGCQLQFVLCAVKERRRVFDIHTYGRELLNKLEVLGGVDSPVLFCRAVAGHQPYDICRYLLAGLQLVRRLL